MHDYMCLQRRILQGVDDWRYCKFKVGQSCFYRGYLVGGTSSGKSWGATQPPGGAMASTSDGPQVCGS